MRIGLYQHGSVPAPEVAEHVSARTGEKVLFRNALYFNERETEKFDRVVVDEGKNSDAIRACYEAAGVGVQTVEEYLKPEPKSAKPAPEPKVPEKEVEAPEKPEPAPEKEAPAKAEAKTKARKGTLDPDAPRNSRKPGKKHGA